MQTAGFIGKIPDSIDFYLFDLALRKKSGSIFGSRERGEAMFVLRAAFWITVVAVLMPREPSLGSESGTTGAAMLAAVQTSALASLSRVRANLEARRAPEPK